MIIKFSNLTKQNKSFKKKFLQIVSSIVDSGGFISGGNVAEFENSFAKYCGVKYCVATSSGTTALHLALNCFDTAGDVPGCKNEVITVSNSYIATSEAISCCGNLHHRFIDVDDTANINTNEITKNIISKVPSISTKILLPVSLYGNPCNLSVLKKISRKENLILINDAAQAHGAMHNGKKINSYSDLTCYSFYPGKNLGTCGEGGAVVTDSKKLYNLMKLAVNHGQKEKHIHSVAGFNYRMSEIEAAMLNLKLPYLDEWNNKRIKIANRYTENLSENKKIKLMNVKPNDKCVYHLFPIFLKNRNKIKKELHKEGIETGLHYPTPIHLQKAYEHLNYEKGDLPVSEAMSLNELSLPIYPEMTQKEVDYVCKKLLLL